MASSSSGNKRRMKIQAGPRESRRRRPQFILFQRTWVRQFESLWGTGLELGGGSGRVGDEWEEFSLRDRPPSIEDFPRAGSPTAEVGLGSVDDSNWNFQSSRGQLRGKGVGAVRACHFHSAIPACHRLPTACTLQIWTRLVAARGACWWGKCRYSGVLV